MDLPFDPTIKILLPSFILLLAGVGEMKYPLYRVKHAHEIGDVRKRVNYTYRGRCCIGACSKNLKYTRVATGDDYIPQLGLQKFI